MTLPKSGLLPPEHYVPDVLAKNLDIVFCGTALGHKSAQEKAYYAHPGNLFWSTLHRIGLTVQLIAPKNYVDVLNYKIGLTDLCKHAFGNDDRLPPDALDTDARGRLEQKIITTQPRILAFTSKTAAACFLQKKTAKMSYGLQEERCGATRIYVLCSPSGLGRGYWKHEIWQGLADLIRQIKSEM